MASAALLFFVLMMSSLRVGKSVDNLITLKCQPAVGVIGQTTIISCSIEAQTEKKPSINTVVITKIGQKKPCFMFNSMDNIVTGDSRFRLENAPSLELHDTMVSDEGEYSYLIRTSQGIRTIMFTINVTAKYFAPVITTEQKEIVNDGVADLYCTANGGYPAGTIHWFDLSNTNWTKNAHLQTTQGDDGLFTLTSKLSFQKIDSLWGQFRCVVLNSKYQEEGTSTSTLKIKDLFTLKCQPAVGVIGQTTIISCSIETQTEKKPSIKTVVITKIGQKKPCFMFNSMDNIVTGDSRFHAENAPSLELHDTMISDEGEYSYFIRTSQGTEHIMFTINVTAKYFAPVITTEQKEIVNDGVADLYCTANGGYPAGTIHWFDLSNTNWTQNAHLQTTQGDDGLFTLTSKLSFQKIDSLWGQFRCVVLNSKYQEEGTSTSDLQIKDVPGNAPAAPDSSVKNIVAAVVVIGSLIVGLLIVLLLKRRRFQRDNQREVGYYEEKDALNDSASVSTEAADAEQKIAV